MSEKEKEEEVEVKVDTKDLQEKVEKEIKEAKEEVKSDVKSLAEAVKTLAERLVEARETKQAEEGEKESVEEAKGKGVIPTEDPAVEVRRRIAESLKAGSLKEQWTAPLDKLTAELRANLRRFITVSEVLVGKPGDTVNVPYVSDFDMDLVSVGGTLTEATGIYGTTTVTLVEAGKYTQVPYADIEKIDADLLARIENVFARAAVRAEDRKILDTIIADANVPEVDKSAETVAFKAAWVAEALGKLLEQGKQVDPGRCVLVLSPGMYEALLSDIAGTQAFAFARPDVAKTGLVGQFMGVNVVVAGYLPEHDTVNHYLSAFLITPGAVVLAPKRELLVETERDTVARKVKITGTHTFGVSLVDNKAVVEIKTSSTT
jgi:HK97 family phage major capsid protein